MMEYIEANLKLFILDNYDLVCLGFMAYQSL